MASLQWFVLGLFCVSLVNAEDAKPVEVLTKTIDDTLATLQHFNAYFFMSFTVDITYGLTNSSLDGLKDCRTTKVGLKQATSEITVNLECKRLTITADVKGTGKILDRQGKVEGALLVELTNYEVIVDGKYEKTTSFLSGNQYISLDDIKSTANPKGDVKFTITSTKEDITSTQKFLDDNAKAVELAIREDILKFYTSHIIDEVNVALKEKGTLGL